MSLVDVANQESLNSSRKVSGDESKVNCSFDSDEEITTVEQLFDRSGMDKEVWRVKKFSCKAWQVGMKLRENGKDRPIKRQLWAVSAEFERIHPVGAEDCFDLFLNKIKKHKPNTPKTPRSKLKEPHLLEIDLFDCHFGKYAWQEETGTDYDTEITKRLFSDAIRDLVQKASGYNVNQILIPVGNDFFQADNWNETTHRGTKVDHDGRFPHVFNMGFEAMVNAVDHCLSVAPVKLIYMPGNHDQTTSWYLTKSLEAWYNKNKKVTVDASPKQRKYEIYGNTLLGFNHGDKVKIQNLPMNMATEVPELWSAAKYREIHIGHFHKQKMLNHLTLDESNGVRVRVLSSLSGTDAWHYEQGYTKSVRAAEAYLWSQDEGLSGQFYSNVKEVEIG